MALRRNGCALHTPRDWPGEWLHHWPDDWFSDQSYDEKPTVEGRLWTQGVFDLFHYGHAGVILEARRRGVELLVSTHSDEECLENKGPTVMTLRERTLALQACRFSTRVLSPTPYITPLAILSCYGCESLVRGDEISLDSTGQDASRFVRDAGRLVAVNRTPAVSTTELIGRVLLGRKDCFVGRLSGVKGEEMEELRRLRGYAADETGQSPCVETWDVMVDEEAAPGAENSPGAEYFSFTQLVSGLRPRCGQRVVYVDGAFDLFPPSSISFLQRVGELEVERARCSGWFEEQSRATRLKETGKDCGPCFVVVGVHSDADVEAMKGASRPVMNVVKRGLCLLQCKYVHAVIFNAPLKPTTAFLSSLPYTSGHPPAKVYVEVEHLAATSLPGGDPYAAARSLGIVEEIGDHAYKEVTSEALIARILDNRELFEERQRKKGQPGS